MYQNYVEVGGYEVINATRAADYARNLGLGWYSGCDTCDTLPRYIERENATSQINYGWLRDEAPRMFPQGTYADMAYPTTGLTYRQLTTHLRDEWLALKGMPPDVRYTLPALDPAPWYDPNDPDSTDFAGVSVMSMFGHQDSTWRGFGQDTVGGGGTLVGGRYNFRTVVVRALLIGVDRAGAQYGLRWLAETLQQGGDPTQDREPCSGRDASFFAICPCECDVHGDEADACDEECIAPYKRQWYDLAVESGPIVLDERQTSDCGYWMEVEWTWMVGNPHTWSPPVSALDRPLVEGGVTYGWLRDNAKDLYPQGTYRDISFRETGLTYAEFNRELWHKWFPSSFSTAPQAAQLSPRDLVSFGALDCWQDPDCFPVPQMPTIPQEPDPCVQINPGNDWARSTLLMRHDDVGDLFPWSPTVQLTSQVDYRDIRIRFTPQGASPDLDYTAQFVVTYLPAGGTLHLDGARRRAYLECNGQVVNAGHLLRVETRSGEQWPLVRSNKGLILTVDVPANRRTEDLDMEVLMTSREPT